MPAPLLVYGGTFDPVHDGHVAVACAAADALGIDEVLLIPAGDPPHRAAPHADGARRADWLALAFAGDARFRVDRREIERARRSYTVDTLEDLRRELGPERPIVLLLGADAFLGLPGWHRPERLFALAHVAVFPRPGVVLDPDAASWPPQAPAPTGDPVALRAAAAGRCLLLPGAVSTRSSTAIRAALTRGERAPDGLPAAVADDLARDNPYRRRG